MSHVQGPVWKKTGEEEAEKGKSVGGMGKAWEISVDHSLSLDTR